MKSSGNALIYVLIAVILLGALSFAISRSSDSNPNAEISDAAAKAAATSILAYEAEAKMAVNQMIQNGTKLTDINYMMPWEPTFNDAPTVNKLFHPDGGGLQWKGFTPSIFRSNGSPAPGYNLSNAYNGYYVGRFNNVAWTPTSNRDVIFTAYAVKPEICAELNRKVAGITATYGVGAGESPRRLFVQNAYHTGGWNDITTTTCPDCADRSALCVANTFYSVLIAR
ncbi:MAG: hypothetical protein DI586_00025 [Micavibrio aeruginosavorus]|uniref:Uncharacterized protein n=1 Tax=Micavibrio aeruginosavorus TaxID=349221 RepID=A0A2W5HGX8_9BACT|nr:MAG: hypothetical protein DI586_00025 [Micavibrio aeruginosavorus]